MSAKIFTMHERKKAQIWYTDFMIGLLVFVVVIFIYYGYAHSISQDPGDITFDLLMDAKAISGSLITKGSPNEWNKTNVDIVGLTNGNQRIVQEKLDMFSNMTYGYTKTKLKTPYDFYFYLEELEGNSININGKEGIGMETDSADNIVSLTRVVIYDSRLVNMVVQVWD